MFLNVFVGFIYFPTVSVEVARFSPVILAHSLTHSSPQRPSWCASAPPYRRPVQSATPIGDDGQLLSCPWPVLWLSTHAVQLAVVAYRDGQLYCMCTEP